jgi:hypothetical protein
MITCLSWLVFNVFFTPFQNLNIIFLHKNNLFSKWNTSIITNYTNGHFKKIKIKVNCNHGMVTNIDKRNHWILAIKITVHFDCFIGQCVTLLCLNYKHRVKRIKRKPRRSGHVNSMDGQQKAIIFQLKQEKSAK